MKLELAGNLKTLYDSIVKFHVKHGYGTTLRQLYVETGIPSGITSVLTRALADLGLVERRDVRRPSSYLALEMIPTDANPYDEEE